MKARLRIGDQWHLLELQPRPSGERLGQALHIHLDGEEHVVDAMPVPGGVNLLVNGRVVELMVCEASPSETARQLDLALPGKLIGAVLADGHEERISVRPPRADVKELRAPMPGRVVRVLKHEGDEVEEGSPVVVVAAMKMENELTAPFAGRVATVHVAEDESVERGALLVRFEDR